MAMVGLAGRRMQSLLDPLDLSPKLLLKVWFMNVLPANKGPQPFVPCAMCIISLEFIFVEFLALDA